MNRNEMSVGEGRMSSSELVIPSTVTNCGFLLLGFAGLKPPAQYMEALRAEGEVHFSGLSRTEAGL